MSQIYVEPIEVEEIEKSSDVTTLASNSESLVIKSQPEYESANELLKEVKARYKELDAQRKEITRPLDEAKSNVMDLYRKPLDLLKNAESTIKKTMINYSDEQDRLAKIEEERLRKIAEAEAEKERKRLQAIRDRAEASGKLDKVEATEEKIAEVEVKEVVVAPEIGKPKGVSYSMKYRAEVIDFEKLPNEYKLPNQSALDRVAQATKGSIPIPGVKIHSEKILSSRGK